MNIIEWYGPIIYDGETIYADGIRFAFEQENIPKEDQPRLIHQINSYFLTLKRKQFEKFDKNKQQLKKPRKSKHGQDNRFPVEN